MINKEIQESEENNKILAEVLGDKIQQARYKHSLNKVCLDLGIEVL